MESISIVSNGLKNPTDVFKNNVASVGLFSVNWQSGKEVFMEK
jgi:hypothetical protein